MSETGRTPPTARHILLVNDTQEILSLMAERFEDEGYRVTISLSTICSPPSLRR
jgi:CheY-like chemotaxis protein